MTHLKDTLILTAVLLKAIVYFNINKLTAGRFG